MTKTKNGRSRSDEAKKSGEFNPLYAAGTCQDSQRTTFRNSQAPTKSVRYKTTSVFEMVHFSGHIVLVVVSVLCDHSFSSLIINVPIFFKYFVELTFQLAMEQTSTPSEGSKNTVYHVYSNTVIFIFIIFVSFLTNEKVICLVLGIQDMVL